MSPARARSVEFRFGVVVLGLLAACGAGDRQAPVPTGLVIEKDPTESGDRQVGVAGKPLAQDFRARVTRDGRPAAGVTVYWSTVQGLLQPATGLTDADGISASRWTTKFLYTEQEAYAGLQPDQGPRVPGSVLPGMLKFTAIATPDPAAANTVLLVDEGDHRFEPSSVTVAAGDTVNWLWLVGSASHNVVPDDGTCRPPRERQRGIPSSSASGSRSRASTVITARFTAGREGPAWRAR